VFICCVVPEIELFFLLQCRKTAFLEMELFLLGKIGKTALSPDKNQAWNRRILGLPGGAGISRKLLQGRNRKWCLEIHATCLIFSIIRQSLALPLVQTGNDGLVTFLECQLTWVHATFPWYS